ncbi:SR-related and CTD-associated factor 4b isoform X2 [Hoplias malabaricus]|uniref:SR-related and CTD-associated factor 4b isoform X2 n=1 Tax=Hoplias malabaricus TaxID=27720 RepID=UPI003463818C
MDAVKAFNDEMASMMDMKPPISRAKMMSITKAGIKAIKLYKHVVQIIEKFIKRCPPELKVPGLYVVDSIVRQSRHQFGEDKDVFGPRFLKNMNETFQSLYQCPPDDMAKILRVLNLWQKNSVFGMDTIQPLLDMASAPALSALENGGTLGESPSPAVSIPGSLDQPIRTTVLPEPQSLVVLPQLQNTAVLSQLQNPAAHPQLQNQGVFPHLQNPQLQNQGILPQLQNPQLQNQGILPQLQNPQLQNQGILPQLQNPPLQNPGIIPQLQNPQLQNQGVISQLQNQGVLPHLQNPQLQNQAVMPQLQNPQLQNPGIVPQLQNPQLQNPGIMPLLQNPQLQNPGILPQLQNPQLQNQGVLPQLQNPDVAPEQQNPAVLAAVAQFLQSTQGLDLKQVLQNLQQDGANAQPAVKSTVPSQEKSTIAKVLLDKFDYDEEPEVVEEPKHEEPAPAVNIMELQQALQSHLFNHISSQVLPNVQAALQAVGSHPVMGSMPGSVSSSLPGAMFGFIPDSMSGSMAGSLPSSMPGSGSGSLLPAPDLRPLGHYEMLENENHRHLNNQELLDVPMEFGHSRRDEREARYNRLSRSPRRRSSSRSRRSRSGSRSHRSRYRRSRSRSRERRRAADDRRERERDREKERERKYKGLPPIKRETLSVCTTTLWLGQLDKKTQQQDISSLMEEYGQIESINMIPPRGCAYIVMVHRQDAFTALNKLSRGSARVNHKPFKIAWALNKGIGSQFKKYWDVDLGVTYIPWNKLKTQEIRALREGGVLDLDTLKPDWASVLEGLPKPVEDTKGGPKGVQAEGGALAAAGPQVNVEVASPPAAITSTIISPPHAHTEKPEAHSAESSQGPEGQRDSPGAPQAGSPQVGAPQPLMGPPHPFMPQFQNNNMPRPNMPLMPMPQGPVFRERNPGPAATPGRFRMPMPGSHEDFPAPRERFPHPRERFPSPGPMEGEHFFHGPPRNDWRNCGPSRGPEFVGERPPFMHRGWGPRRGPPGRGHFEN